MSDFRKRLFLGLWLLICLALIAAYVRGEDPTKGESRLVIDARTVITLDSKAVTFEEFNKEPRTITELKVTGRHVDVLRGESKPPVPPLMPPADG